MCEAEVEAHSLHGGRDVGGSGPIVEQQFADAQAEIHDQGDRAIGGGHLLMVADPLNVT
ncbi:hypothetical protein GCM10009668_37060 [Nocardioides dubius]|uniref:Uncharacterized protein n=1 Tax=Nocardioides dubius TaxID=317019 RepID=A0ABN1U163_9ACTN